MKIGLLGFGVVGRGVYELTRGRDDMQVVKVLRREDMQLPDAKTVRDIRDIVEDDSIDTVVEVMGGLHPAYNYVRAAIEAGKNVVTANKALVCTFYDELLPLVQARYRDYPYYVERLANRHIDYNRTYRSVARWHDEGRLFCIRPPKPVEVASMEKDPEKLLALYEEGYRAADAAWPQLSAYLAS